MSLVLRTEQGRGEEGGKRYGMWSKKERRVVLASRKQFSFK